MVKSVFLAASILLLSASPSHAFGKKAPIKNDPTAAFDGNMVFYITGGPISTQPGNVNDAAAELRDEVLARYPTAYFFTDHNSNWQNMCSAIQSRRQQHPEGKTAIVGHSYGASATTIVARCLEDAGVQVDLAVMLDMIRRPGDDSPEIIPGNVVQLLNYYQSKDLVLRGRPELFREDGSQTGITSIHITENLGATPHFGLVSEVMLNTHEVESSVLDTLSR